jgi:hypothetical protein
MGGQLNGWLELGSSSFMMTACDLFGFLEMLRTGNALRNHETCCAPTCTHAPCAVYLEFVDTFSSDDSLLIFARSWAFTAHLTFLTRITTPTWPVRKRVGDGGAWLVIQFIGRKGMERKFKLT